MNPRNLFLPLLILFLVAACKRNTERKILDFGVFKLTTPAGWTKFREQGIDTYVGGVTDGKDTLHFGYGHYHEEIGEFADGKMMYAIETVNGLEARIAVSEVPGHVAVMIIDVNKEDQFIIDGTNLKQPDIALDIFHSVVFENSDVSVNRRKPIDSFELRAPVSGRELFSINCAPCHSFSKLLTGPALSERIKVRDDKWLYKFLADRASVSSDTGQVRLKKQFGFACAKFPDMSKEERRMLIEYLRSR
ncbi:Cytochrome c [Chitinophaga sp. YR627]|uniref:c-type cytochrome n=1 Tax=Chitinophaga sp. YR627 TaxID=1881041 RepID=UPI0008EE5CB2|nr:c-type cytochrome [Chitinophaga sp. YR627]SFN32304.1 Cytochrome c [Chitinophaga sp. YR627]